MVPLRFTSADLIDLSRFFPPESLCLYRGDEGSPYLIPASAETLDRFSVEVFKIGGDLKGSSVKSYPHKLRRVI